MTEPRTRANRVRPGLVEPAEFQRWTDALWYAVWEGEPDADQLDRLKSLAAWMDGEAHKMKATRQ